MKLIFILAVLSAGGYLAAPLILGDSFGDSFGESFGEGFSESVDDMSSWLPQQKIEQAAQNLLTDVDTKLEAFTQKLQSKQTGHITELEGKLEALQAKLNIQDQAISEQKLMLDSFASTQQTLPEKNKVPAQLIAQPVLAPEQKIGNQAVADNSGIKTVSPSINRQAWLQDIAQRNNQRSLLAVK
jgi:hypothetical protein